MDREGIGAMNFHQLFIFNVVAKHRSYSKAAAELFLSQPTVSVHLQKLEQEIGMELFEQLGRNIYLTDAGHLLHNYTEKIFALSEEAERALEELKGLHKGRVRLGASTTPGIYYLPALIGRFKQEYPGADLVLDVANTTEIIKKVLLNHLDIAVVGEHPTQDELVSTPFATDRMVLILAPNHPLANQTTIKLADLTREKFIVREPGSGTRKTVERAFARSGIHLQVFMEYSSTDGIKHAVAANLGLGIISELAVRLCAQTGLVVVRDIPEIDITREFYLIYHKDKHISPLTQTFIRVIQEYVKSESHPPAPPAP